MTDKKKAKYRLDNPHDATTLRNQIIYDPDLGTFKWKVWGVGRRGDLIAGGVVKSRIAKRYKVVFDNATYESGRLAWVLMTGAFPDFIVDHIDGNPLNFKWNNLRSGGSCTSQRNAGRQKRNKLGITGVRFTKGSYQARIGMGKGKAVYLGQSTDFFEACCIRKSAELKLDYGSSHGSIRAGRHDPIY